MPALIASSWGNVGNEPAVLLIAVLAEEPQLAQQLAALPGVQVVAAADLDALAALVASKPVSAALVDPEAGDSWPIDVARAAAERLADRIPLFLVCRSYLDAASIESQVSWYPATVLMRERFAPDELLSMVKGELARRRARPMVG